MSDDRSLLASFWLMVTLQTVGSVDMPGKGARKMPAPRAYLAVIVAWSVLSLLADAGMERAARLVGWALVITGLVVGPFGQRVMSLLNVAAPPVTPPIPTTIAQAPFHTNG